MDKRIACAAASLLLAVSLFSCSGEPVKTNTTTETSGTSDTAQTTEAEPELSLPDTDMGGREITILTAGWGDYKPFLITDIAPEGEKTGRSSTTRPTGARWRWSSGSTAK